MKRLLLGLVALSTLVPSVALANDRYVGYRETMIENRETMRYRCFLSISVASPEVKQSLVNDCREYDKLSNKLISNIEYSGNEYRTIAREHMLATSKLRTKLD